MSNIWNACADGDIDAVTRLIDEEQVSPDIFDDTGYTPLQAASSWNRRDIAEFLLSKGADINRADFDGDTPLHYCEDEKMAAFLVEHGANPMIRNNNGHLPIEKAFIEENDGLVEFLKPYSPEDINFDILQEERDANDGMDPEMVRWLLNEANEEIENQEPNPRQDGDDCLR